MHSAIHQLLAKASSNEGDLILRPYGAKGNKERGTGVSPVFESSNRQDAYAPFSGETFFDGKKAGHLIVEEVIDIFENDTMTLIAVSVG